MGMDGSASILSHVSPCRFLNASAWKAAAACSPACSLPSIPSIRASFARSVVVIERSP
jgi:hypothetical protein